MSINKQSEFFVGQKEGVVQQLNSHVSQLNSLGAIIGSNGVRVTQGPTGTVLSLDPSVYKSGGVECQIVQRPSGGEKFTDCRYWVQPLYYEASGDESSKYDGQTDGTDPFVVTNFAELSTNTHFLRVGEKVVAYPVRAKTGDNASALHWFIERQPRPITAKIVCPDNGADFTDNRYHFKSVRMNPTVAGQKPSYFEIPSSDDDYVEGVVVNRFEDNCSTHYVRPGTIIEVTCEPDPDGSPAYFTVAADEGTCRQDACEEQSSSSQSSSSESSESSGTNLYCVWSYYQVYNCETEELTPVRLSGQTCRELPAILNKWHVLATLENPQRCIWYYYIPTSQCETPEQVCTDQPPAPPGLDLEEAAKCCDSSSSSDSLSDSSSNNLFCIFRFEQSYNCITKEWSDVKQSGQDCREKPEFLDQWIQTITTGDGEVCNYLYYTAGPPCEFPEQVCEDWPPAPPSQTGEPLCCGSSSSESSSDSDSGSTSDTSSGGGCDEPCTTIEIKETTVTCDNGNLVVTYNYKTVLAPAGQ